MAGLSLYLPTEDTASDPLTFADLWIWTRDDPPAWTPFVLNPVQTMLLEDVCRAGGVDPLTPWLLKGARANVLKARQQGSTTLWVALWYLMFYNLPFSQTLIITHRADSTARIWQRVQLWERKLREQDGRRLPRLKYSSRRELMREDTGSSLYIGTAGEDDLTRSGTITNLHKTESAFWPIGSDTVDAGALGTLPAWANIVEESTANGYGEHKDRWEAQEAEKERIFRVYFFPFTDTVEYAEEPPTTFTRTQEERSLTAVRHMAGDVERMPLTDEQVFWLRKRAAEFRAAGTPELVGQEFPLSPRQAFLASATGAVFDVEYLEALSHEMRGLEPDEVVAIGQAGFGGAWTIWEQPEEGIDYVLSADVAEGHDEDDEHDFSYALAFRCDTREEVSAYWGRPSPEHFAEDLAAMSLHFNRALCIPERNAMGLEVISELRGKQVKLYRHNFVPQDPNKPQPPEHTRIGYPTNTATKALRDGKLQSQIRLAAKVWKDGEGRYTPSEAALYVGCPVFRSQRTINELIHYSNLPGKKRGGKGAHDDAVTSATIGNYYLEEYVPQWRPKVAPAPVVGGYGQGRTRS